MKAKPTREHSVTLLLYFFLFWRPSEKLQNWYEANFYSKVKKLKLDTTFLEIIYLYIKYQEVEHVSKSISKVFQKYFKFKFVYFTFCRDFLNLIWSSTACVFNLNADFYFPFLMRMIFRYKLNLQHNTKTHWFDSFVFPSSYIYWIFFSKTSKWHSNF